MKYILRIGLLVFLYTVGLLLFTRGFLLTRVALSSNSTCDAAAGNCATPTNCLCPNEPRFRRAVLIVVDALRFDFVADFGKSNICDGDVCAGGRRLQILSQIARDRPFNSRLYRFIADPPTTTLQRLKGLTTGSLPTFVDAGTNFASTEITEDNFIDQCVRMGKNITFMGDDTWQSLFPGRFARLFPFPSFNVKDLDTVDNGVIEHLETELLRSDWQLLIAHFLGVDHCGHTFGPKHPKMAEKLEQMDSVLRAVINLLDNDTVLFVLGDHGMTATGDHGGDSVDELDAALFVYSPAVISDSVPQHNEYTAVSQVDLVPTVSLMLGIPVPFSNLGTVIVDLFHYDQSHSNSLMSRMQQKLTALQLNAEQVQRFLHEYSRQSSDLPQSELNKLDVDLNFAEKELKELFSEISATRNVSDEATSALTDRYIDYLGRVRSLCRSVWSKFDLVTMAAGGAVFMCAFLFNIIIAVCETKTAQLSAVTVAVSVVGLSAVANLLQLLHSDYVVLLTIFAVASFLITTFVFIRSYTFPRLSWSSCSVETFSMLLCCVHSISLLSNSFVVYEDRSALFFVQSLLAAIIASQISVILRQRISVVDSTAKRRVPKELPMTLVYALLLVVALAACVRASTMFRSCREEQVDCEVSWFAQPLAAIPANFEHFRYARLTVSIVSVVTVIVVVTMWLRHCGNLNGWEPAVVAMRYIIPVMGVCLCVYWLVDGCMLHHSAVRLVSSGVTALPRLVYVLSLATVVVVVVSPLCMFMIRPQQDGAVSEDSLDQLHNVSHEDMIAQIYDHVRKNWRSVLKSPDSSSRPVDDTPVVYGLATVYSAGHIVLLTAVAMVMMLVFGDNMAPSIALWVVCEVCLLELHAANAHCHAGEGERSIGVPWSSIALVSLLSSHQFFGTGHQATIAGIPWTAAFHGFREDHTTIWLPALLVSLNTFASHMLCTLSLPLLIYWPFTRGRWMASLREQTLDKGEFQLNVKGGEELRSEVYLLVIRFILLSALKVLALTLCVTVHRRHLMVWKIFAPRYIYECAAFLVISVCCVVTYLFVARLNSCLRRWVQVLCNPS